MDEMLLAIQYLEKRAVSTEKCNDQDLKNYSSVIPLKEVKSVLNLVKDGQFLKFHNDMKEKGHPDFI